MTLLAGTAILTANPIALVSGQMQWTRIAVTSFVTTDSTPTTPTILQRSLEPDSAYRIKVEGHASDATGAIFEFDARNAFTRTAAGVSVRLGTVNGQQVSVGNSFPAPANTRPKITFTDPAATHQAWPIFTGRDGVSITWCVLAYIIRRL